ncbi:MAG TPA: hypothetical protein VNC16_08820 [Solirubrobacterales bacterium]|jgi:hypothetical protein|nr:hypothetical protein [Solirubrobacterales bacterium]
MPESGVTKKHGGAGRSVEEVFESASRFAVERAARRVKGRLYHERWLASTNMYLNQAPTRLKAQFKPDGKHPKKPLVYAAGTREAMHLAEYIAASAVLHCVDGWTYLGRALAAQLRGDSSTSRHLGYYAELRAAVSLLAGQGVGVFAGPHVILKESNDVEIFHQLPTHAFAWNALSAWTDLPGSVELLGDVIQPADARLVDWLAPLAGPNLWQQTGRDYLRYWGLDVERFGRDREARNDSSYQPRTAFGASPPASRRAVEFSSDLWRLFEPLGATNFDMLDRYLLRRTLRRLFALRYDRSADDDPQGFQAFFEQALGTLQTSESEEQLTRFLNRQSFAEEPPLFAEAELNSDINDPEDHFQVIARAALLLRVASGSAQRMLGEASLPYLKFEWWSRQIAASRALAEADMSMRTPELLWLDVEEAITGLDEKVAEGDVDTYSTLTGRCPAELSVLGGCERIALWALAA